MKTQLTTLAAAIALTASAGAMAISNPYTGQQDPGGNTHPSNNFEASRNVIDSMRGFNGNEDNAAESIIYQNGNDNRATVTQSGQQWSRISQTGNKHEATVNQQGYKNESNIIQLGNSKSSWRDGNIADVSQNGTSNDSYVRQDGRGNDASVTQFGDLNDSYINQNGKFNEANVNQSGNELDSDIFQTGYDNMAAIGQSGFGHDSYTYQHGDHNQVTVNQSGSWQNFSHQVQVGHNNTATVTQY